MGFFVIDSCRSVGRNQYRLHYLSAGSGETILFIHGWPTSAYLYRQRNRCNAQNMRVVALDLPGFGKSDKPLHAPYTFDFYDRILTAFAEHLGMDQVTLVGHDIGEPRWGCSGQSVTSPSPNGWYC